MVSKKADKNYIEDSKTTPKSCLDVVFQLLATTTRTSSSNLLPESIRLLSAAQLTDAFQLVAETEEAEVI